MLSKKNIVLTFVTAFGAALLVLTQTAGSKHAASKLEGAWICKVPGTPMQWTVVYAPDPSGHRASMTGMIQVRIPADLWFPDLPPGVDGGAYGFVGEAVMTGPDTANTTMVGYAIKKVTPSTAYPFGEQVLWIWLASGENKFSALGKAEFTGTMGIYLPEADADGDGLPDPGQKPLVCFPATCQAVRLGLMPPCNPPTQ